MISGIDIHAYMVKDVARAMKFYRDGLGLEPTTTYPNDGGAEYELSDGSTFGLWNPGAMMPFQPSGGVMFAVDDIEAARTQAVSAGATMQPPFESPVCWISMGTDTEGNTLILHKRKQHD
jgi:predicted enzyme related to lactoylglutathione lyase